MKRFHWWWVGGLIAASAVGAELPPVPFTAWQLDFEAETAGAPPSRLGKTELEARRADFYRSFPVRKVRDADFVTATRYPVVRESPLGFTSRALTLVFTETAQPNWGPRLFLELPNPAADAAGKLTLTLEVAKNAVTRVGGFSLDGVCDLNFTEAGEIAVNRTRQLGRYTGGTPVRFRFVIDNDAKTVAVSLNDAAPLELPWNNPRMGAFRTLRLDGLLPGGYARDPGEIAFDNILLNVDQWRKK